MLTRMLMVAALCAFTIVPRTYAQVCSSAAVPANLTTGVYTMRLASGKALDEEFGNWADGAVAQGWDYHGGANQRWLITALGSGRYLVRSAATGKALDASSWCYPSAGCPVITWGKNMGVTQIWRIEIVDGMYRLRLAEGGTQLALARTGTINGDRAELTAIGCMSRQLWRVQRVGDFVEKSLTGLKFGARVNNYTPNRNQYDASGERAFFRPNDSWFRVQLDAATFTNAFSVPVVETGDHNMYKLYVNEINSTSSSLRGDAGAIKIAVSFEDAGTEIVSDCYNNFWCGFSPAPTFNLANIILNIWLIPGFDAVRSKFGYTVRSELSAAVAESGPCVDNFFAFMCERDRAGRIKSTFEMNVNDAFNGSAVRNQIELLLTAFSGGKRSLTVASGGELLFF